MRTWSLRVLRQLFRIALSALQVLAAAASAAFKSRATLHLEMHPLDTEDRVKDLKDKHRIGYCNITTCSRPVCPEFITITENAIIPLKERVGRRVFFDPHKKLFNIL